MGFGRSLKKRLRRARKAATSVAKTASKVVVPIQSKGAVKSVVRGVEKYGKAIGTGYALGLGGLVGAAAVKRSPGTFGKTSSNIAATLEPIERVTAVAAGTALGVGGLTSTVTNAISGSEAGDSTADFGGGSTGPVFATSSPGPSAAATGASSPVLWIAAGGLLVVVVLLAVLKRKKR